MLRKLIKYEFKSTWRIFVPLYGAILAMSIVFALFARLPVVSDALSALGMVLFGLILLASTSILVLTISQTLGRFRSNLMQNEGYLMMTLPVSADSLILSKMIAAAVWATSSFLVVATPAVIMFSEGNDFWTTVDYFVPAYPEIIGKADFTLILIEMFVFVIVTALVSIALLYACLSLGMLVSKKRDLLAFGTFTAVAITLQIIASIVFTKIFTLERHKAPGWLANFFDRMSVAETVQFMVLVIIVVELALCVAFYFVTRHMLKRRLNLQ